MTEFDPHKNDAYTKNLETIAKTNDVITSENVYNEQGALLIKKGRKLNDSITHKLQNHRLMKPLQNSVMIKNAYTADRLNNHILTWLEQYPDLSRIHKTNHLERPLKKMCQLYASHPILVQMVTVFSLQLPDTFQKGCFSAWLSIAIAQNTHMNPADSVALFIAALCHDIGLIHIPESIVNKSGKYEPDEWRTMQAHTVIGKIITSGVPGLHNRIPKIILQHHESFDGTGYPYGHSDEKLLNESRIVSLCDTLYPLRFSNTNDITSIKSLQSFLQVHQNTFRYENYAAIRSIFNTAQLAPVRIKSNDEIPAYCMSLVSQYQVITVWAQLLNEAMSKLPTHTSMKTIRCAQKIFEHFVFIINSSGMCNLGIKRFIEHVATLISDELFAEVENIGLMYNEVFWQMKRLFRQIHSIHEEALNNNDQSLSQLVTQMTALEENRIPEDLQGLVDSEIDLDRMKWYQSDD